MAGEALILRYQWRAYWRRFFRSGRAQFYVTTLLVLGWYCFVELPPRLWRAAEELTAGQTATIEGVLPVVCLAWLLVVGEDANLSLTSRRLLKFPLTPRALLAVRLLSIFCSPLTWLIAIGSLMTLFPLFTARHPVLGSLMALSLFALTLGVGMCVSQLLGVAEWRRPLLMLAAIAVVVPGTFLFVDASPRVGGLRAGAQAFNPAQLVTALAVADSPSAMLAPIVILSASAALIWWLLVWSFRRSLYSHTHERAVRRVRDVPLPGRLGGLVRKEQRDFRQVLDFWLGLLLVLIVSAASLWGSLPPLVRESVIVIVAAFNANVTLNCLGLDRPSGLNRYLILPIRGRDVLFAKNLALLVIFAAQISLLIAIGVWQSGVVQVAAEIVVATVLLLSHLAWGNVISVSAPLKIRPYRFAPNGEPLTAVASALIGSLPGLAVIVLFHSEARLAGWAIPLIVLATVAVYVFSLRSAGASFEHRVHSISDRLA